MKPRTIGAICLGPKGNIQGGYNFMSLVTGEKINRRQWTALPVPAEVIEQVHQLAKTNREGLTFQTNEEGILMDEEDSLPEDEENDFKEDHLGMMCVGCHERNQDLQFRS